MSQVIRFAVDPKIATLLGEAYQSSERAIKELVDNSWDADASTVRIALPKIMSDQPIVIEDDGSGMTEEELRTEYVKVARDRRSVRGDLTNAKKRRVRGRRGVGKFAGLMVAEKMEVHTSARAKHSSLVIERSKLVDSHTDFEALEFPFSSSPCDDAAHGTSIKLFDLNRRLSMPNPEKLKRILVMDFGRETDFKIYVNDEPLSLRDIPGESYERDGTVNTVGDVKLTFTISDGKHPMKHPGIVVKVDGKPIGEPSFFGLDKRDDVPTSVLKRIYGEVEAPGLLNDITADWSTVIENSVAYEELQNYVQDIVKSELEKTFEKEFKAVTFSIQQQIAKRIQSLPEHRRSHANTQLQKILLKLYGESEEKIAAIVNVVLDALERDEYWDVLKAINSSAHGDVQQFADALTAFGLIELTMVGTQAKRRAELLDSVDALVANKKTQEKQLHQVIETNLWILGAEYALLTSNRTMRTAVEQHAQTKYSGKNAAKRPDLLLLSEIRGRHLLIEFKRPNHSIDRDDESQAQGYRDDFGKNFHPMKIMLIGGSIDTKLRLNPAPDVEYISYADLCTRARAELTWLINSLAELPVQRRSFFN